MMQSSLEWTNGRHPGFDRCGDIEGSALSWVALARTQALAFQGRGVATMSKLGAAALGKGYGGGPRQWVPAGGIQEGQGGPRAI